MSIDTDIRHFPVGGGVMGEKIRAYDWDASALGPIRAWPPALRMAVEIVLASKFPKCLVWGPALIAIHNDAFMPILGDKPEALGRSFHDVWSEVWDTIEPIADRAFAGEATFIEDLALEINRHGRPEQAFFTFCYSPIRDETGAVVGMMDTVIETTGKVVAERQLREERQRQDDLNASLERLVAERTADRNRLWQLSTDIMLVARFDGVITAVNPALTAILGWTEREMIGRDLFDLIHPEDLDRSVERARTLAKGETLWRFDNRYRHKDGSYRWITWTAVPGEGLINAVGRDVTADKEQAEALHQARERLHQSQKMEAVGQLTGGMAHDFNNLLTAIAGSLELLKTRLTQGRLDNLGRYIDAAQGAAGRAAALTHRLLAFSRQQALDPKPIQANRLVAQMEELIRRTVGPEIEVRTELAGDLWPTLCDPNQLENALLNLCINARDAMPDGGRLTIGTANAVMDEHGAREQDMAPGQYVAIRVTDTGTGMTPEVVGRAFDPFFTTKPLGKGTGLGLSMIYGFARQSGGQVRIASEPGKGTAMQIYLPRHWGEAEAEQRPAGPAEAPRADIGETVLIVDDEAMVRMLVTEVLQELGYAAIEAADGASGLEVLQSRARIDLLITDVGLPGGMNGRQMADAARQVRPELKVLFITGYAEGAVLGQGQLEAGMQVMTKPFAMEALGARIREIISGS
ncbi:MAG TPA: PAS domain S-box protein [Acetobacteraceae bacterium]